MTTPTENKTHPAKWRNDNRARIEDARTALDLALAARKTVAGDKDASDDAIAAVMAELQTAENIVEVLDAEMLGAGADLPASVLSVTKDGATLSRTALETAPGEMFDPSRTYITYTLTDELRAGVYAHVQTSLKSGTDTTIGLVSRDIIAKHLGVTIDLTRAASTNVDAYLKPRLFGQYAYEMAHADWNATPEGIAARNAAGDEAVKKAIAKAEKRAANKLEKETAPAS